MSTRTHNRAGYQQVRGAHGIQSARHPSSCSLSAVLVSRSDDDEGFECQKGPKGWENGIGDADDGKGFGGATDAADGGLSWPVIVKDFLGREFATEEDAYAAYKEFARFRGFGVRKGDAVRVKGVLIRRDFFCHRQGIKHPNHSEQVWEERLESRTDCKAKLKIYHDVQHNVWKVSTIIDEHNHELALTIFTHLLPSHRKMSDGDKTQYEGLERLPQGLILSRWCKDAKNCRSKPLQIKEGHHSRLLRYGTLSGAMSLVAKLGSKEATDFVLARDDIASLAEVL
ncbi:hypothetical protein Ahy_B10g104529 [Arachis hypogaea]|uniref:FAR1 domain-containing protein n=1 Tax=Arachis hypogaea TaxID=3818 RepID=A0A444X5S8_ARAHY|nr:hypothetical protein Ahy_B10g104529 [Arachis hypogaea]